MQAIQLPEHLGDGVVLLRAFVKDDAPELMRIIADPEVRNRNHVPLPTLEEAEKWIARAERRASEGGAVQFAICDVESGQLAGRRGIRIDHENRRASVGCWLAPEWRGREFASRSALLVAAFAFANWPVDRIGAECDVDNLASYKSLLKAGFHCEGILRSYSLASNGGRRDQYSFSLLPSDLTPTDSGTDLMPTASGHGVT